MADRYYCDIPITAGRAVLNGPEAHHFIHVMRARAGDRVTVFDGSGFEFSAVAQRVGRAEVELAIVERVEADRELPVAVVLGVALPKGDRQKWLVEKTVELGVARLVPLAASRAVAQPAASAMERLRRGVVEASKQCGRNRLMEIAQPKTWPEFLDAARDLPCRWLAHPRTATGANVAGAMARGGACKSVALAVGPEGGFTDDEVASALQAGWRVVDLGPRILRVETAAIALAAMAAWGEVVGRS
jgi:16S rRNA (uracil1498-N3)-methyltransferase